MTRGRTIAARAGAAAVGLGLGALIFVRYGWLAPPRAAHTDHAPRHGGVLGMVGDVHMEIVRRDGAIHVYLSDAHRRPLRAEGGQIAFEGGPAVPLVWDQDHLTAPDDRRFDFVTCTVVLGTGEELNMSAFLGSPDAR